MMAFENKGLEDNGKIVPERTLIGTTAKGLELMTRKPLNVSGMNGAQFLAKLDEKTTGGKPTLYPIDDRPAASFSTRHFIWGFREEKAPGMIGTCIASLEDLGHVLKSPSTKELIDPRTMEEWNKRLQGFAFVHLPQTSVLDMALAGSENFPIRPDGHVDNVRGYEMSNLAQRSVNAMPDGSNHGLYVSQAGDGRFVVSTHDTIPEFRWSNNTRLLLGVRKL